ncbi:TPA: hypothetical protein H1P87_004584 [Salmonella enterica]|nr:hypothetical protein [Salmonella enterica]ECE6695719.1 hypothetical protein [Salmonella enterica subsp. diarizonae]ECJ2361566.1 hypothetical protein [Salmonella enterica subsp. diarizonae]ECJ2411448.1 hypothetical protein [Salmonella enterica subsp. diarizonae]EDU3628366.1 hypothetical protein [Salmonella enterica]
MKLIIPDRYRQNRKKPREKPERAARAAYSRLLNDDWSHVRRLERVPPARVINVMYRYRLLSLDEGQTWELLNHNEYVKRIRRCYR